MSGKVVDFRTDVVDYTPPTKPTYPNIRNLLNQVFIIEEVSSKEVRKGRIYYVKTNKGTYYTFSKVLAQQLDDVVERYLSKGLKVRVKLKQRGNYLTLAPPE